MDSLPIETIAEILSWVPTLDLRILRYVCQKWRNIIDSPLFCSLHCSHSLSRPYKNQVLMQKWNTMFRFLERTDGRCSREIVIHTQCTPDISRYDIIIGSSTGLLCLGSNLDKSILVLNPFTRQFLVSSFAPPVVTGSENYCFFSLGFGYDVVNKFYKVIVIVLGVKSEVRVCDLGCGGRTNWRNIGNPPFEILSNTPPCFINGRLHWAHRNDQGWLDIVSFDLADEVFRLIPTPEFFRGIIDFDLIAFEGNLCMFVSQTSEITPKMQIWAMMEYGVEDSWVKKFDIIPPIPSRLTGMGSVNEGKILLKCLGRYYKVFDYYLFDPTSDQFELLEFQSPTNWDYQPFIHTASLMWI